MQTLPCPRCGQPRSAHTPCPSCHAPALATDVPPLPDVAVPEVLAMPEVPAPDVLDVPEAREGLEAWPSASAEARGVAAGPPLGYAAPRPPRAEWLGRIGYLLAALAVALGLLLVHRAANDDAPVELVPTEDVAVPPGAEAPGVPAPPEPPAPPEAPGVGMTEEQAEAIGREAERQAAQMADEIERQAEAIGRQAEQQAEAIQRQVEQQAEQEAARAAREAARGGQQ